MNRITKASLMASSLLVVLAVGHYFMFSEKDRNSIKNMIKDITGCDDSICD